MKANALLWAVVLGLFGAGGFGLQAAEDRGYLGIALADVPESLAQHFDLQGGVLVESVAPGSPAEKAGLKARDVIAEAAGQPVKGPEQFKDLVRGTKPGDSLKMTVLRGTEKLNLDAAVGSLAEAAKKAEERSDKEGAPDAQPLAPAPDPSTAERGFLGVGFGDVPPILATHLGLAEGAGIVVNDVWKESPAKTAGLAVHDVLTAVDGYEIKGAEDFARLMSEKKPGDKVKVEYFHKGAKSTAEIELAQRPKDLPEQGLRRLPGNYFQFPSPGPQARRKGRVIIEGPQGKNWQFELPEGIFKAEQWSRDLQSRLKDLDQEIQKELSKFHQYLDSDELKQRIQKLTEELDHEFGKNDPSGSGSTSVESSSSVIRNIDGDYDISVKEVNGNRTVSATKAGKSIAQDLPWDKIETLPDDVRARVEKLAGELKPAQAPSGVPRDSKIKA